MRPSLLIAALLSTAPWWMAGPVRAQSVNEAPPSWTKRLSVELVAPQTKRGEEKWDFNLIEMPFPSIFGVSVGTSPVGTTAPDMWLVVIDAEGSATAYLRGADAASAQPTGSMILKPAQGLSLSRCPDSFQCEYRDLAFPEGCFGLVVLDQDVASHDFMLAAVVYEPGRATEAQVSAVEGQVHAYLAGVTASGGLIEGGPAPGSELPLRSLKECEEEVCFSDEMAGTAGVRFLYTEQRRETLPCGPGMIEGRLYAERLGGYGVELTFEPTINQCSGEISLEWDFGDAFAPERSTAAAVTHVYDQPGVYEIAVTPTCRRTTRSCVAEPVASRLRLE
ncbi:MAG: PKD domain-containing protein [Acidobacteria bacterium]|nr:PKD domain-containing protein [Acidobacteriota bacterium]